MSNKTDLQALNANYKALIEELRGKASGGSGGSGALETCTVVLNDSGNCNIVYYTLDSNGEAVMKSHYGPVNTSTLLPQFTVIKGSHLLYGASTVLTIDKGPEITGEAVLVSYNVGFTVGAIFKINGDCSITLTK